MPLIGAPIPIPPIAALARMLRLFAISWRKAMAERLLAHVHAAAAGNCASRSPAA